MLPFQLKLGMRFFSFDRFLNLIRSDSFLLDMNDRLKTWWKSIKFEADFTFLYRSFESLSRWLTRSFLLHISSRNKFFWHCLYVKEVRKVALAISKHKNLGMTLWSLQINPSLFMEMAALFLGELRKPQQSPFVNGGVHQRCYL